MHKSLIIRIAYVILVYIAASIITLHSLLPHHHHDELDEHAHSEEHADADGLIDYLKLIFHSDLGEGHMENFEQSRGLDFDLNSTLDLFPDSNLHTNTYYPLFITPPTGESRPLVFGHEVPIPNEDVIAHLDFRGPPFLV